jgi:uncharacterized heparinase superfamily protein
MGFREKVNRYYHTLRYLRWPQIYYRVYYLIRQRWRNRMGYQLPGHSPPPHRKASSFVPFLPPPVPLYEAGRFCFLNIAHPFKDKIDWDLPDYGKLWAYNLNYFEFLSQDELPTEQGLEWIRDFIANAALQGNAYEPFPTSLRAIFWIRFLMQADGVEVEDIEKHLYRQLRHLSDYREYHLLGNHLLENGFALFAGACYFQCPVLLKSAAQVLQPELKEQILPDGGHFERSPMYHQLMLYRLLDCLNISRAFGYGEPLQPLLLDKAERMLGWLDYMRFRNGDVPAFNDSAPDIAPSPDSLIKYAGQLNILPKRAAQQGASGYYKFQKPLYELCFDAAPVGPDYIPGHAHSDTLSLVLQSHQQPFLVDPGISTYEKNERRHLERSTNLHNTVQAGQAEQTEVWGGFRVARRARPKLLAFEPEAFIRCSHDGYAEMGITHTRSVRTMEEEIHITDEVAGKPTVDLTARWHFAPGIQPNISGQIVSTNYGVLIFEGAKAIQIERYKYAAGYNKLCPAKRVAVSFEGELRTIIRIESNLNP